MIQRMDIQGKIIHCKVTHGTYKYPGKVAQGKFATIQSKDKNIQVKLNQGKGSKFTGLIF